MAEKHFYEQIDFAQEFLVPYFEKNISEFSTDVPFSILSVGCPRVAI